MNTQAELTKTDTPGDRVATVEVVHWDGRIDNRADLLLLLNDWLCSDNTDAALARAAYKRWGIDGFGRLIGDWSLVIRDDEKRMVTLASDFAGVRPLYYRVLPGRVVWSNRLSTVVETNGESGLDDEYLHGFLLFGGCPNRTPYKDICSVPPGHAVCVSPGRIAIRRFWELPIGNEIYYRTETQYEEQLRSLFGEAVAVRLRTPSPVLAELSGGLDSSSVVTMAQHLMRTGAIQTSRLIGLSYVWRNSLDEPFIREVQSFCGINGIHISTHEVPLISATHAGGAMPEILQPLRVSVADVARRLRAKTILTGMNGDLVSGNWFDDSLQVAGSLRELRIGRAFEEALAWSRIVRRPVYSVLSRALRAALPWSPTSTVLYDAPDGSYAPMSTETSIRRLSGVQHAHADLQLFSHDWMQAPPERRKYFRCLSTVLELRTLQPPECLQHLDYTHPFAHRPLVEFLMAVPARILCRPGEPRRLMRSALSDLWPPKLRTRRSKGLFNAPWQAALRPLAREILNGGPLHLVDRGFLDRDSVLSRLQRLTRGLDCNEAQLRHIIVLELWLRNRAKGCMPGGRSIETILETKAERR